ncbi:MAG: hypothetical protein SGILL_003496 [Bacillariaceae sp.]
MKVKRIVPVTITSDLMCPWCWVGLRKMQQAAKTTHIEPKITWKPFQLRPGIPEEGQPKGGTPASRVGSHLKSQGRAEGIDFTGLTDRTPNTSLFHATIAYLQDDLKVDSDVVTEFHEAVFEAYFTLGIFPDQDGLLTAAKKVKDPVVAGHIQDLYANPALLSQLKSKVQEEARMAAARGIDGVPTFSFGGKPAFSGAQSVSTFSHFLEEYAEQPAL